MRTVVTNDMVAHLWANQSQSHARNAHHSVSFQGKDLYSYRTRIATFTDKYRREDPNDPLTIKRVVLIHTPFWGVTTSHHISNAHRAARHHMIFSVERPRDEYEAHVFNCRVMFTNYEAECKRICNPRAYWYRDEDTLNNRLAAIFEAAREYRTYASIFLDHEPYPNFDYWVYLCRTNWAKYYDPAQADARAAKDAAKRMKEYRIMAHLHAWAEGVYSYGHDAAKDLVVARDIVKRLSRRMRRQADSLIYQMTPRDYARDGISFEDWLNGEGPASVYYGHRYRPDWPEYTALRRKGERLETSQGAQVPWQDAKRMFRIAQAARCRGEQLLPSRLLDGGRIGSFMLTRIDPDGSLIAGCHMLKYEEMQRLAIREAPEIVQACYPVPALFPGNAYRDIVKNDMHVDVPTQARFLAPTYNPKEEDHG